MRVEAEFKGKDGSLGYRKHQVYKLNFITTKDGLIEVCDENYLPDSTNCGQVCQYHSLKSFLDNWKVFK